MENVEKVFPPITEEVVSFKCSDWLSQLANRVRALDARSSNLEHNGFASFRHSTQPLCAILDSSSQRFWLSCPVSSVFLQNMMSSFVIDTFSILAFYPFSLRNKAFFVTCHWVPHEMKVIKFYEKFCYYLVLVILYLNNCDGPSNEIYWIFS